MVILTDLELEIASQALIDFMLKHDDIYGKYTASEYGAIFGTAMFVLGQSHNAWLHADDALLDNDDSILTDPIEKLIQDGKAIQLDNN
jgi:hypothetical protein